MVQPMPSKVSVIIPSLNEELNIVKTLKAVLSQKTKFDYDIVVCDGGSTDKTVKLARKYAKVLVAPEKGKSKQLNYAVKRVYSEIIVFIDADIIILPDNYLQQIYDLFKAKRELWACGTHFKHYTKGYNWKERLKIHFVNFNMPRFYDFHSLLGITKLPGCSFCIRRDIFIEVGGFKDIPNEDSVISNELRRLAKKKGFGKIKYIRRLTVICSPRKILELGPIKIFAHYSRRGLQARRIRKESEK